MKKLLLLLPIFAMSLFLASCGGDEGDCVQADFVGTYEGTKTSGLLGSEDLTFEVTEGTTATQVIVDGNVVDIDGCDISGGTVVFGTGQEYNGSLDGTTITVNQVTKLTGLGDETITWTGTKQ